MPGRRAVVTALPADVRLQAVRGDTVWALRVGELDEVWVAAYELRMEPARDRE